VESVQAGRAGDGGHGELGMWVLMSAGRLPEQGLGLTADRDPGVTVAVAGAHGGAGVSTLAVLLGSAQDLGVVPRHGRDWLEVRAGGRPLVLVARNTVIAAECALAAINAVEQLGGRVAVLAVVSDGLPVPKAAAYRFRVLTARVGALVRVPFVGSLRLTNDPAAVRLPHGMGRALGEIRALTSASTEETGPVLHGEEH
jgi:hypothetical protein